jgi:gliding motility-associated-like protein
MSRVLLTCILLVIVCAAHTQSKCPDNIGFEKGNFNGWECAIGTISNVDFKLSLAPSTPQYDRQTLQRSTQSQALDFYGGFPVNPPNGSEYSIRLGNPAKGAQAEQVSYTFTIPQDQNNYSIIYYYAVVFQNPGHSEQQQPKFTANVYDVDAGNYIGCSSFSYAASSDLPGFKQSTVQDSVFYKEWTPVTIKLSGMAGRTIRLEFTTNDCSIGGHFGYAYVDVSQNCTSPVTGNVFCASTEEMKLIAPFGFAEYAWFNGDFSQKLGNSNTLSFKPVPKPNTKYAVELKPYPGQGCLDTIYTTALYSNEPLNLKVKSLAYACVSSGMDLTMANITAGSGTNLTFSYFIDPELTSYVPVPKDVKQEGDYYIMAENVSGCTISDKISVHVEPLPVFRLEDPPNVYRPNTVDLGSTIISSAAPYNYRYWLDSPTTKEVPSPHSIDKTGKYYIAGSSTIVPDCSLTQAVKVKILDPLITPPNLFTPNGDGVHDTWLIPQLAYYPECILEVFSRSGKKLWRSDPGYTKPWDGKYEGKSLPVDTYYYVIKLNNELPNVAGSITIVR